MSHTQALYYPWIDVRNAGWLKTSSLFWEKIQTIVPTSIEAPYEHRTAREFEDAGILVPLRVESDMEEIESLSNDVLRYLSSDEAANLLLSTDRNRRAYLHPQKLPNIIRRLSHIHPEKMGSEIRYMMEELGFGRRRGDWMEVDGEFASFYMTLLATRLSERFGLGLLTDSSSSHRLSSKVGSSGKGV